VAAQKNGSTELDEDDLRAIRDVQRISAGQAEPTQVTTVSPFGQEEHDRLVHVIGEVATNWVEQLKTQREKSEALEQLVLERAAHVRDEITRLYMLGHAAMLEAKRAADINETLKRELLLRKISELQ
jgi:hypothetical protein